MSLKTKCTSILGTNCALGLLLASAVGCSGDGETFSPSGTGTTTGDTGTTTGDTGTTTGDTGSTTGTTTGALGTTTGTTSPTECTDTGAAASFSFFVTSYHHIQELSGSADGFGGDLRYNGAASGLEGADAICQEIARRVCHGDKTWKAFLSTSTEDAIDRVGTGPWYDYAGQTVAEDTAGLVAGDRPSGGAAGDCCDLGIYDELGNYHDGSTDLNNDGLDDDDHDILTASDTDGRYSGDSCSDWTSTAGSGPIVGHSWPSSKDQNWISAHAAGGCLAGVNLVQEGPAREPTVGDAGGYGGLYCFAL